MGQQLPAHAQDQAHGYIPRRLRRQLTKHPGICLGSVWDAVGHRGGGQVRTLDQTGGRNGCSGHSCGRGRCCTWRQPGKNGGGRVPISLWSWSLRQLHKHQLPSLSTWIGTTRSMAAKFVLKVLQTTTVHVDITIMHIRTFSEFLEEFRISVLNGSALQSKQPQA